MKIAQVAPIWTKIPPGKYGGTETLISYLTEGMVKKGHEVTLFATGDSVTKANLVPTIDCGLLEKGFSFNSDYYWVLDHVLEALERFEEFDILHLHLTNKFDYIAMALVREKKHVLFTPHMPLLTASSKTSGKFNLFAKHFSHVPMVSISNNQRSGLPLNFIKTVYNGIDLKFFPFNPDTPEKKILYFSRISLEKGTREAILASVALSLEITVAGNINTLMQRDIDYYNESIKHFERNPLVKFVGEIGVVKRPEYYKSHYLMLFPIQWEEPFGLVVTESMACGTPVIAFARGATPEIIKDGVTGLLVNPSDGDIRGDWITKKTGMEGLQEAIEKLLHLPKTDYIRMRRNCREYIEGHFTVEKMVDEYEKVYADILRQ